MSFSVFILVNKFPLKKVKIKDRIARKYGRMTCDSGPSHHYLLYAQFSRVHRHRLIFTQSAFACKQNSLTLLSHSHTEREKMLTCPKTCPHVYTNSSRIHATHSHNPAKCSRIHTQCSHIYTKSLHAHNHVLKFIQNRLILKQPALTFRQSVYLSRQLSHYFLKPLSV